MIRKLHCDQSLSQLKADGADVFSWKKCWSQSICQSNTWERNELHLCFNYSSKTIQGNCQSCTFSQSTRDITHTFFHKWKEKFPYTVLARKQNKSKKEYCQFRIKSSDNMNILSKILFCHSSMYTLSQRQF